MPRRVLSEADVDDIEERLEAMRLHGGLLGPREVEALLLLVAEVRAARMDAAAEAHDTTEADE